MSAQTRSACCSCGQLTVECEGNPALISLCHCLDCQRRTGSSFGIAAFFPRSAVRIEGSSSSYARSSDSGSYVSFHFCPHCGSTVYWKLERRPETIAVAVGCFADPSFPAPVKSVYEHHRHPWVVLSI